MGSASHAPTALALGRPGAKLGAVQPLNRGECPRGKGGRAILDDGWILIVQRLTVGSGLAALAAAAARHWQMLTRRGAWAAWILGTALFAGGGWGASLLLLLFFFTSSLLSRLPEATPRTGRKGSAQPVPDSARSGSLANVTTVTNVTNASNAAADGLALVEVHEPTRDERQVWANAGVATIIALLAAATTGVSSTQVGLLAWAGLSAAIAEATADTWASEIGRRYGGTPRRLRDGRPVAPGSSGGVTRVGTAAAGAAAVLMVAVSASLARLGWYPWATIPALPQAAGAGRWFTVRLTSLLIPSLAAWAAVWLDSWLGSTVQARFWCAHCQTETESRVHRCGRRTRRIQGWHWLDNNGVNAVSTALAAFLAIAGILTILTTGLFA